MDHVSLVVRDNNIIKAKINSVLAKNEIMRKKKTLGQKKIYIDHDLSAEERKINGIMRQKAKKLREKGSRVKIGNRQILVNGTWHQWDVDIEQLLINAEEHSSPMEVAAADGTSLHSSENF